MLTATNTRWNQKFLDYEIETWALDSIFAQGNFSWNQKFLDYEIETFSTAYLCLARLTLKSKVSRLRDWNKDNIEGAITALCSWNQKFLDYEIETNVVGMLRILPHRWNQKFLDYEIETGWRQLTALLPSQLKSKVSRLRDWNRTTNMDWENYHLWSWNQKFLDYEIETPESR